MTQRKPRSQSGVGSSLRSTQPTPPGPSDEPNERDLVPARGGPAVCGRGVLLGHHLARDQGDRRSSAAVVDLRNPLCHRRRRAARPAAGPGHLGRAEARRHARRAQHRAAAHGGVRRAGGRGSAIHHGRAIGGAGLHGAAVGRARRTPVPGRAHHRAARGRRRHRRCRTGRNVQPAGLRLERQQRGARQRADPARRASAGP